MSDEEAAGLLAEQAQAQAQQGWRARFREALRQVAVSPYFWANVVYVVYTVQALAVDYCSVGHPDVLAPAPAPAAGLVWTQAPQCAESGDSPVYRQYVALAVMHLVNAFQYLWLWRSWFRDNAASHSWFFLARVLAPEFLNILEASLYLHTATRYGAVQKTPRCVESPTNPDWFACPELLQLHTEELYASLIELVASFLWFWSWMDTAEHELPGRGFSLWDLDLHSSYLLIVGSLIYTVYNYQIDAKPQSYGSNRVYKAADVIYFVGALLYMGASLRDCDLFFWVHVPCHPARRQALRRQREPGVELGALESVRGGERKREEADEVAVIAAALREQAEGPLSEGAALTGPGAAPAEPAAELSTS